MPDMNDYLKAFTHLHQDRTGPWTPTTCGRAPHKPLLLLAVLDLAAQGELLTNFIEPSPALGELFASYWEKVIGPERRGNFALPFFHLRKEKGGYWQLIAQPGQENALPLLRQIDTLGNLRRVVIGAKLDEDLFLLLQASESREALRRALVQAHFAPEIQSLILGLGVVNLQAYQYGQELLERAAHQIHETPYEDNTYVRDQGFRRVVVRIYEHRCAFCGLRILTVDGRTAVDAAHVVPWRLSHDDDIHNGMALCQLCHWTFDSGLTTVNEKYLVQLSTELRQSENMPGYLLTVEKRRILGPQDTNLWPALDKLAWHRQEVFRKG